MRVFRLLWYRIVGNVARQGNLLAIHLAMGVRPPYVIEQGCIRVVGYGPAVFLLAGVQGSGIPLVETACANDVPASPKVSTTPG